MLKLQEREQQRLDKIHALQKTDIATAIDKMEQTQKDIEETTKTKEEIAAENREKKLREKLERIRLKREHAELVRQRRLVAAAAAAANPLEIVGENPQTQLPSMAITKTETGTSSPRIGSPRLPALRVKSPTTPGFRPESPVLPAIRREGRPSSGSMSQVE